MVCFEILGEGKMKKLIMAALLASSSAAWAGNSLPLYRNYHDCTDNPGVCLDIVGSTAIPNDKAVQVNYTVTAIAGGNNYPDTETDTISADSSASYTMATEDLKNYQVSQLSVKINSIDGQAPVNNCSISQSVSNYDWLSMVKKIIIYPISSGYACSIE